MTILFPIGTVFEVFLNQRLDRIGRKSSTFFLMKSFHHAILWL